MGGLTQVTFAVEEAYRGIAAKTVHIYTNESGAGCGYPFQQDARYLVFASMTKDGQLTTSLCSATRPAQYAEEDIAYLRSIPFLPPTAEIVGSLWRYTHDPNFKPKFQPSLMDHYRPPEQEYKAMIPVVGAVVTALGRDGKKHPTVVDIDGNWRITGLTPGPYSVQPQVGEATFVHPFEDFVDVAARGCAEVHIRIESNGQISGMLAHGPPAGDWALLKVFVLPLPNPDWRHPTMEITLKPNESAFEIGPLPPGRYVLGAYVVKTVGTPDRYTLADFGRNYYPGVWDPNLAQPIDVAEGKAVTNVRFKVLF
jgi:hypothetical protein